MSEGEYIRDRDEVPKPILSATPKVVMIEPEVWDVTFSPSIAKLVEALAKAQLKYKAVLKQNENAAFVNKRGIASKYADLSTYIDATQEALATEGLVVIQFPDVAPEAKSMRLVSILAHSSGEWMKGKLTLPATGRDGFTSQSCGSSITYARRYSYAAITGCASEDDDGNAASGRGTAAAAQEVGQAKVNEALDTLMVAEIVNSDTGEVTYEVSGLSESMNRHKDLLMKHGKRNGKHVDMTAEGLDTFREAFVEGLGGHLKALKAR